MQGGAQSDLELRDEELEYRSLPIVSIVVLFWLPYRILNLKMVKPREGSAMETIVTILVLRNTIPDGSSRGSLWVLGFRAERRRPNKSVINTMNI